MRAVIYARVSTDEQRGNYSIPSQVKGCTEYAADKNYSIVGDQFIDPVTGFDTSPADGAVRAYVDDYSSRELSRPGLDAAIGYLETTGYDVLVVHAIDRLARDPFIRRTLEIQIKNRGATVAYVLGDYDQIPEGEVRKDLDATFAKWENARRRERSMRGMKEKAKHGLFASGRSPFGYAVDKKAFGGLAVVEEQAEIVRSIFQMYVTDGMSIREIAKQLTKSGKVNHSGNSTWGKSTIARMLKNTVYAGWCYFNKHGNCPGMKPVV